MFAKQGKPARQAAMRVLISTKMAEGTPIQEHMLKMMDSLNELDVLGAVIDAESQIDIILESLPESFNNFKVNYNINKMKLTLAELSNQLVVTERIMKKKPTALMTKKSDASPSRKAKGEKAKRNQFRRVITWRMVLMVTWPRLRVQDKRKVFPLW